MEEGLPEVLESDMGSAHMMSDGHNFPTIIIFRSISGLITVVITERDSRASRHRGGSPKRKMTTKRPPKGRISISTPDLGSIFLGESVFDTPEAEFL